MFSPNTLARLSHRRVQTSSTVFCECQQLGAQTAVNPSATVLIAFAGRIVRRKQKRCTYSECWRACHTSFWKSRQSLEAFNFPVQLDDHDSFWTPSIIFPCLDRHHTGWSGFSSPDKCFFSLFLTQFQNLIPLPLSPNNDDTDDFFMHVFKLCISHNVLVFSILSSSSFHICPLRSVYISWLRPVSSSKGFGGHGLATLFSRLHHALKCWYHLIWIWTPWFWDDSVEFNPVLILGLHCRMAPFLSAWDLPYIPTYQKRAGHSPRMQRVEWQLFVSDSFIMLVDDIAAVDMVNLSSDDLPQDDPCWILHFWVCNKKLHRGVCLSALTVAVEHATSSWDCEKTMNSTEEWEGYQNLFDDMHRREGANWACCPTWSVQLVLFNKRSNWCCVEFAYIVH